MSRNVIGNLSLLFSLFLIDSARATCGDDVIDSNGKVTVKNCTLTTAGTPPGYCFGGECLEKAASCTGPSDEGEAVALDDSGTNKVAICNADDSLPPNYAPAFRYAFVKCTEDSHKDKYCQVGVKKGYCKGGNGDDDCVNTSTCASADDDLKICHTNLKLGVCNRQNTCQLPSSDWKLKLSTCPSNHSIFDRTLCVTATSGEVGICGATGTCRKTDIPSSCASGSKTSGDCVFHNAEGAMVFFGECAKGDDDKYDCYGTCDINKCKDDFDGTKKEDGTCKTSEKCIINGNDPGCCVPKESDNFLVTDKKDKKGAATRSGLLTTLCLSFVF